MKIDQCGGAYGVVRQAAVVVCFAAFSVATTGAAYAEEEFKLTIPAQPVASAVKTLSYQTKHSVLFQTDQLGDAETKAITGTYSLEEALDALLQGTGLQGGLTESGVIVVSLSKSAKAPDREETTVGTKQVKRTLLSGVATLLLGTGAHGAAVAQESDVVTDQSQARQLDTITVTATRRETSLSDTAISIAAIGGREISRRNLSEMDDYLRTLPNVSLVDQGVGRNAVVVRGIGINPEQEGQDSSPTVGVYFGEVPLAGFGAVGGTADIIMTDLERVEVLRGPQGTLFGSGSLGGAVRNIPKVPNLKIFEGSLKGGYSNTARKGGGNTKVEGVVNIPLVKDVLAVRAVGYQHHTSGFVKNIAGAQLASDGPVAGYTAGDAVARLGGAELYQNEDDVGNTTYAGGRISALWKPAESLKLSLQYLEQDAEQDGLPYVQLNTGGYTQVNLQMGNRVPELSGKNDGLLDHIKITNFLAELDLGWANLMASSAWVEDKSSQAAEVSSFLLGQPSSQVYNFETDAFIQEVRLASQLEGPMQFLAGVYYEEVDSVFDNSTWATSVVMPGAFLGTPGDPDPFLAFIRNIRAIEQLAFFGEVNYQLNDQLKISGGVRRFDYERSFQEIANGVFGDRDVTDDLEESGTNYSVDLSYSPNEDALLYAKWAEGFRLGDARNAPPALQCDVNNDGIFDGSNAPLKGSFDSDSTETFELGAKLSLLDRRAQINAAAYVIDWSNIPLRVPAGALEGEVQTCFTGMIANAGDARSQGFEFDATYQLTDNIRFNVGGSYTHAELTAVDPAVPFHVGERLANSPEYNANVGLQYDVTLFGNESYLRGDYAYVGDYYNLVGEQGDLAGGYGELNINAGTVFDDFTVDVFIRNLTNDDAFTNINVLFPDTRAYRLRPRTVGLNIGYKF